ncbi:hypothetical protein OPIT5_30235 [Opitutaceae bacterium TAV5]|nr:hypothetical protein OPIT5_30235 [Opitutaceae bacterium TAV5]
MIRPPAKSSAFSLRPSALYTVAPLLALAVFAGFYWRHAATWKERQRTEAAARIEEQRQRIAAEQEARRIAYAEAIAAQEKRKREREEREARRREREAARDAALARRDQAGSQRDQLVRTLQRLEKDIPPEADALEKYQRELKAIAAEQAFLTGYLAEARQDRTRLAATATRLTAAAPVAP